MLNLEFVPPMSPIMTGIFLCLSILFKINLIIYILNSMYSLQFIRSIKENSKVKHN